MTEFEVLLLKQLDRLIQTQVDCIAEIRDLHNFYKEMHYNQEVTVIQHTMPRKRALELNYMTGPLKAKSEPE